MNNSASNHNQSNETADQSSQQSDNNTNSLDGNSPNKTNLIQKPKADKNHDDDKNITTINVGWISILVVLIFVVGMLLLLYYFFNVMSKFVGNIANMFTYMFSFS